jgi:hypothetical protein
VSPSQIASLMQRLVLPPGFEPRFAASETAALSIELREQRRRQLLKLRGRVNVQKLYSTAKKDHGAMTPWFQVTST